MPTATRARQAFSWTELHRAKEIIDAGEKMVDTVVPKIKALLPFYVDSCRAQIRRNQWRGARPANLKCPAIG